MIVLGILIPFIGTAAGAGCVLLMRQAIRPYIQKFLLGFAAGVMIAASVWSLLIPAMESSAHLGRLSFMPAAVGFLLGILFLLTLDQIVPHLHLDQKEPEGLESSLSKTAMLVLAVTLHNIPEGMAVGVVFAGLAAGESGITVAGCMALAIGIAIQNFPEGAIISMPLKMEGLSNKKAFLYGAASGIVEPIAAGITVLMAPLVVPVLPYLLSFAAGAMVYVVVEELIPESAQGSHSNAGTVGFAIGFVIMMILDVALG